MFADMELGTRVLVFAVLGLILFFGIKNGKGDGKGGSGSSTPPTSES